MSTPINHHYVSQCHIRNFFNKVDKRIYCYDKQINNHYSKDSSKTLFSEDFSNSKIVGNQIDHKSLEDELNLHFENDFENHVSNIVELANNPDSNDESKLESLYYIACYALISDVRFPMNKTCIDETVDLMFIDIAKKVRALGDEKQAELIEASLFKDKKVKHSNILHYNEAAARRLERMGDLDFKIFKISSSDLFILPDTGCIQTRGKINNYINPYIQEIAILGIPITDKVFVFACSKKVGDTSSGITTINNDNSEIVNNINDQLFDTAFKTVATSDKNQLKRIHFTNPVIATI